jgi:hypothetical protein
LTGWGHKLESIHDRVKRDRTAALPEADKVQDYRNYAEGVHCGTLSSDQRNFLHGVVSHDFADNVCDLVLTTAASRLELTAFRVDSDPVQTFLDELFTKNQLGDLSFDVHYRTPRDGNHAVGLRWLPDDAPMVIDDADIEIPVTRAGGRVTIHHEPWWDGKDTGVFVAYDDAGQPSYAVKDFFQTMGDPPRPRKRRTIYFPDHLERYLAEGNGWQPIRLESDPAGGIDGFVEWTKANGSPLGIPIVHFANGRFGKSPYGASDLSGGVLGLQDEINDIQRDITAAARLTAFQMIAITGVDLKSSPIVVGPGRVINVPSEKGNVHGIPPGDMSQLISAHEKKLTTVARNTQPPQHIITGGDWPSGAALLRAEIPLVSKVQRMAKTIGPGWTTVAHRATELANAFGRAGLDENALIQAVFAPPEKLDALALAEIDKARVDMVVSLALIDDPVLLKKTGLLTDDEIAALMTGRKARAADAVVAQF